MCVVQQEVGVRMSRVRYMHLYCSYGFQTTMDKNTNSHEIQWVVHYTHLDLLGVDVKPTLIWNETCIPLSRISKFIECTSTINRNERKTVFIIGSAEKVSQGWLHTYDIHIWTSYRSSPEPDALLPSSSSVPSEHAWDFWP